MNLKKKKKKSGKEFKLVIFMWFKTAFKARNRPRLQTNYDLDDCDQTNTEDKYSQHILTVVRIPEKSTNKMMRSSIESEPTVLESTTLPLSLRYWVAESIDKVGI